MYYFPAFIFCISLCSLSLLWYYFVIFCLCCLLYQELYNFLLRLFSAVSILFSFSSWLSCVFSISITTSLLWFFWGTFLHFCVIYFLFCSEIFSVCSITISSSFLVEFASLSFYHLCFIWIKTNWSFSFFSNLYFHRYVFISLFPPPLGTFCFLLLVVLSVFMFDLLGDPLLNSSYFVGIGVAFFFFFFLFCLPIFLFIFSYLYSFTCIYLFFQYQVDTYSVSLLTNQEKSKSTL